MEKSYQFFANILTLLAIQLATLAPVRAAEEKQVVQLGDLTFAYPKAAERTSRFFIQMNLPNKQLLVLTVEEAMLGPGTTPPEQEPRKLTETAVEESKRQLLSSNAKILDVKEFPRKFGELARRNVDILIQQPNSARIIQKQIYLLSKNRHFATVTVTAPEANEKVFNEKIEALVNSIKMR